MLINDLEHFKKSANRYAKIAVPDHPNTALRGAQEWNAYPVQDFDYQFNSWGFRGPEYTQFIGKPVNICLGDSFTVNVGGPIEHSWCSQLALHFDIPTLNLGMSGAGNDAIKLVYERACKIFDVQDTFVMYSYLHRRLVDTKFEQEVHSDSENFKHFLKHKIPNVIECALPFWCWLDQEKKFIQEQGLFFLDLDVVVDLKDHILTNRKTTIIESSYHNLRGPDWPTFAEFINGADPHPDMFIDNFGKFVDSKLHYTNRDGFHLSLEANKIYADYHRKQKHGSS